MQPIRVLVTACGCPGASTLIRMLKNISERDIEIIGIDCDNEAIGRFLADRFYQVPRVSDTEYYLDTLEQIIKAEQIDVILPESSLEVPVLAKHKDEIDCPIVVSSYESIQTANNKYLTYKAAASVGVKLPKWSYPRNLERFVDAVYDLGYPDNPVCFKPHIGKGSRGFRVIDSKADRRKQLLDYKPNARYITLKTAYAIFENDLPDLLVMEYLRGKEYTSDCLCMNGRALLTMVKSNEQARWGVTVRGELVNKPEIAEQVKLILSAIPLSYNVNLQFIDGKLIEINPRVSTFIYQDDLIPPYLAIKLALGEISENEVMEYQVQYGRRFIRYMDQVFF